MGVNRPLQHWIGSPSGRSLLQREMEWNRTELAHIYGMHLMQLGLAKENFAEQAKEVHHPFVMDIGCHDEQSWSVVEGEDVALPIATESLSAVILPHVLEFSTDPHQVLREVTRVLVEDGEVLIYGFSPWSYFRLRSRTLKGHYLSQRTVVDWLTLLGYEIRRQRQLPLLTWSWKGSRLNTGAYQLVAKRRVTPLNPIHSRWKRQPSAVAGNLMGGQG